MRLFIALNFDEKMKSDLYSVIKRLDKFSEQGNFTRWENLHLTLHFIGETSNVKGLKTAMDKVNSKPFDLIFKGLGCFKRNGGDIYWIGAESQSLWRPCTKSFTTLFWNRAFRPKKGSSNHILHWADV